MTTPDNYIARSPIPVYALALPRSDVLIYAGGGGRSRSGVSNAVRATTIDYDSREVIDRAEEKLSNDEDAPMCLAISPGEEEEQRLLIKKEEDQTTGTNDNLRVLDWSSSGYKPSSQLSVVEKVTDLVKEQVNNDDLGENLQDVDVQTIHCVAKASSIPVHDSEQYIKVTAISPNGKYLAVGSTAGQIALHSFPSLEQLWITTPVDSSEVVDITFSSDSALVAFVLPNTIQVYSTAASSSAPSSSAPEVHQTIRNPSLKGTTGCVFRGARFGRSAVAGEVGRSDRLFTVVNTNPPSGLGSSKKDREKAKIRRCFLSSWDADKWTLLNSRKISDRPATVFALSENGKYLAVSTSDLNIHLLSTVTLSTIWKLKEAHAFPGTCLGFSPLGDVLVSGSADMSLRVIKVGDDQEPAVLYNIIHSKEATLLLALLLALLALYIQQRIAPGMAIEVENE
ncbi:hypothetical protein CBS101457_003508 [Exobasidium rhododendri]|nr:hypothetical protein CBS101457_003508 [Exobasidium rhododendri]